MSPAQPDDDGPRETEAEGRDPASSAEAQSAFDGPTAPHLRAGEEPNGVSDEALDTEVLGEGGPAGA